MAGFPELEHIKPSMNATLLEVELPPYPVPAVEPILPIYGELPAAPANPTAIQSSLPQIEAVGNTVAQHRQTAAQQKQFLVDNGRENWLGPDGVAFGKQMDEHHLRMGTIHQALTDLNKALGDFAEQLATYKALETSMQALNEEMRAATGQMEQAVLQRNEKISQAIFYQEKAAVEAAAAAGELGVNAAMDEQAAQDEAQAVRCFEEGAQLHARAQQLHQSRVSIHQQQEQLKQRVHEGYQTALVKVQAAFTGVQELFTPLGGGTGMQSVADLAAAAAGVGTLAYGAQYLSQLVHGSQSLEALKQSGALTDPPTQFVGNYNPAPIEQQLTFESCGAACGSTVLQAFGQDVSQAEMGALAGTTSAGTRMSDLATALNSKVGAGTYAFQQDVTQTSLEQALTQGKPAIVALNGPGGALHAVVVDGIRDGSVVYRDPWTGTTALAPLQSFLGQISGGMVGMR